VLVGKMGALKAAKIFNPEPVYKSAIENIAAPFLKGDALLKYLASTFGIKGMTTRGLPLDTIQGVVARCMKEKSKKMRGNDLTMGCISSYVEIFKSDIKLSQQGLPDFIIDMGYSHLFEAKWTETTPQHEYNEATGQVMSQHLKPYLPKFADWTLLAVGCKAQHTKFGDGICKQPIKPSITDEGCTKERYYTGLTNLLVCTRMGRYQEGLVYGFDLLSHWEKKGGDRPADLYLLIAECCGALHCYEAAHSFLEKACHLKHLSRYQKSKISTVVQSILRHWGCFEDERSVFEDAQNDDKFSAYYADGLRHHLDALVDYAINTLAIRMTNIHYHRFCDETCINQHPNIHCSKATRDTLYELKQYLHLASIYLPSGNGEYYTALHQVMEAADMTLQLQSTSHILVQTLLHSSLHLCQLGISSIDNRRGVDPKRMPLKALKIMLNVILGLTSKAKYIKKMATLNIGVARTTRSRSSLEAGATHFTVGVLLAILGLSDTDRTSQQHLKKAEECYGQSTYERSYRYNLANTMLGCLFKRKHHGITGQSELTDKLLVGNASGDSYSWMMSQEWVKNEQPIQVFLDLRIPTNEPNWPEKMAWSDLNIVGSMKFGLESIAETLKIIL